MEMKVSKKCRETIDTANKLLYHGKCNLHEAASLCGLTSKEMKFVFTEFVKYNPPTYSQNG